MKRTTPYPFAMLFLLSATVAVADQDTVGCATGEFETARQSFHRTWFEQADVQFDAYFENCEQVALAHAYAAVIGMLLYRDNAADTSAVERLAGEDTFAFALARFSQGKLAEAETSLRAYLDTHPDDRFARHVLGFTLIDQDKNEAGIEILAELLEDSPDFFPAMNHLAYGSLKAGDQAAAHKYAEGFVRADPGNPSAWDTQASILNELGDAEAAIASQARGILLDSRFAYGYRHMGNLLKASGNDDAARAAYRQALDSASQYGASFSDSLRKTLDEMDQAERGNNRHETND